MHVIFNAGILVIVVTSCSIVLTLATLFTSQRRRRQDGILNARFFRSGSGLVFTTLAGGLVLGFSLIALSRP